MRCSYASHDCCARAWQILTLELPFLARIWCKVKNTLGYILHTGKKVRLQIRIDHKMFDIFTSRNVKKNLLISTLTSDQIVGLRECWLSNLSDILGGICRTWEYDRWYTWSVLYFDPLPTVFGPTYPWYFDPPNHGISTLILMVFWPPSIVYRPSYPWYNDPLTHGILTSYQWYFERLPMV
jgi:hypothetical protein